MKIRRTWFSTQLEITPEELKGFLYSFKQDEYSPYLLIEKLLIKLTK